MARFVTLMSLFFQFNSYTLTCISLQLASQADEPIAMTDDEKRRLKELLDGIDDLPDVENIDEVKYLYL